MNQLTDTERNSMKREEMIQTIDALCSYVTRSLKKTYKRVKAGEQDHIMNLATERGNYVLDYAHRLKANLVIFPAALAVPRFTDIEAAARYGWEHASWEWENVRIGLGERNQQPAAAVPEGYSEDEIADAFITVGVWDNKFEALMDCLRASRRAMLAAANKENTND